MSTWLFGYGSLVWRPDFPYLRAESGYVRGWARRFWQASHDHRGVPEAPGRVVTLVRDPASICWGRVYEIDPEVWENVARGLDHREKDGYARHGERVWLSDDTTVDALVYVATPDNPSFLGDAPLEAIAAQVRGARGPSGSNVEYVIELARALRAMGAADPHVEALAEAVRS
ncbi:MAG: gamma-glutamylcyclotransferase [Sandaracinus sp.]|nr:gamma-glutamylcyclotransferase [Sandaracinus sp.]MCB9636730.1 gamma-glutamylcyclotransferase [Sandaracinus sp.]